MAHKEKKNMSEILFHNIDISSWNVKCDITKRSSIGNSYRLVHKSL